MSVAPSAQLAAVAPAKGSGRGRRGSRRQQLGVRIAILVLVLGYLILPLFAMLEFSTRERLGSRSLDAYAAIIDDQNLVDAISTSLGRSRR